MGLLFSKGRQFSAPQILGDTIFWDCQNADDLVWKYPSRSIRQGAKLQVHDSQEAALFIDGKCVKVFHGGGEAYTIDESATIPALNDALNVATDGTPIYFAEIWFVNISTLRKISWFCDSRNGLKIREKGGVYSASLSCECTLQIVDTEKFLMYFVGKKVSVDAQSVTQFFKSNLISASVSSVTDLYKEKKEPFDEFIGNRDSLQNELEEKINANIVEYLGLQVGMLAINDFFSNDLEEYWAIKQHRIALEELGINYMQSRQLDIAEAAAKNEGAAGVMMGMGATLGMGVGMGQSFGNVMSGVAQQAVPQTPPPIIPITLYYYVANNAQQGPVNAAQLQQLMTAGTINQNTMVWREGLSSWVNLASLPEFSAPATPPPFPTK